LYFLKTPFVQANVVTSVADEINKKLCERLLAPKEARLQGAFCSKSWNTFSSVDLLKKRAKKTYSSHFIRYF
jgi:hypothetical protein